MTGVSRQGGLHRLGIMAVFLLSALSLAADPIVDIHEEDFFQPKTIFTVTTAILLEAGCVLLLLRHCRTPRWFVLWIVGMHFFTYPLFLTLVWLAIRLPPKLAVATGELSIIVIEGSVVYLMCRYAPSAKTQQRTPSIFRSLFASLVGNACSAAAFPLLIMIIGAD